MSINTTNALETLRPGQQWVCFDSDKKPYNPVNGQLTKANDPTTWATYEQALAALKKAPGRYAGVGRELIKEQELVCTDLDDCIIDGQLTEHARQVVSLLNSYTEYSPSGNGLHIWTRGAIPDNIGANDADGIKETPDFKGIEMNDCKKYYTVTGNHLAGTPESIEDRQGEILQLYNETRERRRLARLRNQAPANHRELAATGAGDTPYGLAALKGLCSDMASTGEGSRNQRLNECAFRAGQLIGGGELARATVERELYNAAAASGLDDREISATMRSGLDSGQLDPKSAPASNVLTWPAYAPGAGQVASNGNGNGHGHAPAIATGSAPNIQFVLDCLAQSEWGDALLFAHLFTGQCLFDHTAQEWYIWHRHAWKRDDTARIRHYVSGQLSSVYLATAAQIAKETGGDEAQEDKRKKRMGELFKRAQDIRTVARSRNVLTFAASQDGLGIMAEQWDTNPWRLATPNGVLDLRTGECRPGQGDDYIRTICPTEWAGLDAPAPRWLQFLDEIFELKYVDDTYIKRTPGERAEMVAFLQRLFGYGITGEIREQIFAVLYGEDGRNGKDTLQKAISQAIGAQSGVVSNDILLDTGRHQNAGGPTPHLSALQGKRIAWANEPEKGARFNVGQVKQLSGGGQISTRNLHEKHYTDFDPTFLLVLLTNHKPYADADDSAFWQRLRLVTFDMSFVDKPVKENERKKDATLWEALKQEAPGILAWLVRGCLEWQRIGLAAPENVLQAGADYREEVDTIATFIAERCLVGPAYHVRSKQLYDAYSAWCKDGNMHPQSSKNFGQALAKRYAKERDNKGLLYIGLALIDPDGGDGGEKIVYRELPECREVQGQNGPYTDSVKPPVEPIHSTIIDEISVGSVGSFQEIGNLQQPYRENGKYMETPYTPYTNLINKEGINRPVEPVENGVYGENSPYTDPTQPSNDQIDAQIAALLPHLASKPQLFWHVPGSGISNGYISASAYVDRLRTCLASGDRIRIQAALDDIERRMA